MGMKRVAAVRAGLRGGSALFLSMAVMGSAMAQEPVAEEEGAIVVTGSRIPRPDVESNSPVNVIGQDEIKYSATVETEQTRCERTSHEANGRSRRRGTGS